jgi:hypothetical protein
MYLLYYRLPTATTKFEKSGDFSDFLFQNLMTGNPKDCMVLKK